MQKHIEGDRVAGVSYAVTFYRPLIQDNSGEPVPETIGHINPTIITILSTSNQTFTLVILDLMWLLFGCWDSLAMSYVTFYL